MLPKTDLVGTIQFAGGRHIAGFCHGREKCRSDQQTESIDAITLVRGLTALANGEKELATVPPRASADKPRSIPHHFEVPVPNAQRSTMLIPLSQC